MDHRKDIYHSSKKKCNQPDCQKLNCWYVHKTLIPTGNDVINQQDLYAKHVKTMLQTKMYSSTIGNVSIEVILCVNTFSQRHVEEAAIKQMLDIARCGNVSLPLVAHNFSLSSCHKPEPYVRPTAKNIVTMMQQQKLQQQPQQKQHQEKTRLLQNKIFS